MKEGLGVFSEGEIFGGEFEIDGTGTKEGAETKNYTKSVNISIHSKYFKVIFIVS